MGWSMFRIPIFFTAILLTLGLCQFDLRATPLGQNSNSSVTDNSNTGTGKATSGRSTKHRTSKTNADATDQSTSQTEETTGTTNQTGDQSNNMTTTGGTTRHRGRHRRSSKSADAMMDAGEQTDLSGTYTGTFDCGDAGLTGDTTLTITGNQFTTADGKSGRIVANTTRGYTGVAVQFGEMAASTPGQPAPAGPMIISMRAKKNGDRLILTPARGAMHQCSFMPSGSRATSKRRSRHAKMTTTTGTADTTTSDTSMTTTPESTATPQKKKGRRGRKNSNANMNMDQGMSGTDSTGSGNANPSATPSPTPQK